MSELAQGMILTDRAAAKVRKLREGESNPNLKLRVYITGGGCSRSEEHTSELQSQR